VSLFSLIIPSMQASAQGNPSAESSTTTVELREALRRRFRDENGFALDELRKQEAFEGLEMGPWAVFSFLARSWRLNPDAWPSQRTIGKNVTGKRDADDTGESAEKSVRRWLAALLLGGFIVVTKRTHVFRNGHPCLEVHYGPGPTTVAAIELWAAMYPKGEPETRPRPLRVVRDTGMVPGADTGMVPAEPTSSKSQPSSDHCEAPPLPPPAETGEVVAALPSGEQNEKAVTQGLERPTPEQGESSRSGTDPTNAELAHDALAMHFAKEFPGARPPACWSTGPKSPHAVVIACLVHFGGTVAERREFMRDAIAGAIAKSTGRFPTVGYVFGSVEWAIGHAELGKRARLAELARVRLERARQERLAHVVDEPNPVLTGDEAAAAAAAAIAKLDL
jgi:hypothetical protein